MTIKVPLLLVTASAAAFILFSSDAFANTVVQTTLKYHKLHSKLNTQHRTQTRKLSTPTLDFSPVERWVLDQLYSHRDQKDYAVDLIDRVLATSTGITHDQVEHYKYLKQLEKQNVPVPLGGWPRSAINTISSVFLVALLTDDFSAYAASTDATRLAEAAEIGRRSIVIDIRFAVIDGLVDLEDSQVKHEICLQECCFSGQVKFSNCKFTNDVGLQGSVFESIACDSSFDPFVPCALDSMNISGSLFIDNAIFAGPVALFSTRVAGDLSAENVQFNGEYPSGQPDDMCACGVNFKDIQVRGTMSLRGAKFKGPTTFASGKIGKNFIVTGATFADSKLYVTDTDFEDTKNYCVCFLAMDIGATFDAQDTEFDGNVCFDSVRAAKKFKISPDKFKCAQTNLRDVDAGKELLLSDSDFGEKNTYDVDGIKYESIQYESRPDELLLDFVNHAAFSATAYNGLEAYLANIGRPDLANRVYFARNFRESRLLPNTWQGALLKIRSWLFMVSVGYGRYPILAVAYGLLIVLFGAILVFRKGNMTEIDKGDTDRVPYSAFWYSLSMFLPVAELEISKHWRPTARSNRAKLSDGDQSWRLTYLRMHILLGWLIVPIGLASISGLIK